MKSRMRKKEWCTVHKILLLLSAVLVLLLRFAESCCIGGGLILQYLNYSLIT